MSDNQEEADVFINSDKGDEHKTVTAEEMIELMESFNLDNTEQELNELLEAAKNGESIDRDELMAVIAKLLEDDQHLEELNESIETVQFDFRE